MNRRLLFGTITIGILYGLGFAQSHQEVPRTSLGAIEGQVLDATGHPLSRVRVYATVFGGPLKGRLPSCFSNEKGKFLLSSLAPGTYMLHGVKEDEGYPDTLFAFYVFSPEAVPVVTVDADGVTRDVVIRLGQKAGKLVGRIVDAVTNKPVENPGITLYREDDRNVYVSLSTNRPDGQFEFLIPPTGAKMKVSASGYESWYYGKDGSERAAGVLSISADTSKEVVISLRPIKGAERKN